MLRRVLKTERFGSLVRLELGGRALEAAGCRRGVCARAHPADTTNTTTTTQAEYAVGTKVQCLAAFDNQQRECVVACGGGEGEEGRAGGVTRPGRC